MVSPLHAVKAAAVPDEPLALHADIDAAGGEVWERLSQREAEVRTLRQRVRELEGSVDTLNFEIAALRRIGAATGHVVNTDDILPMLGDVAKEATNADSAQVYLFDDSREWLVLRASTDAPINELNRQGQIRLRVGEGITGWVAREKLHVAISVDAWSDERFKFVPQLDDAQFQSLLSVPLLWRGDVLGVVSVRTRDAHEYTPSQIKALSSIASQVAGAIQTARSYRSAERRASHLSTVAEVSRTITANLYLDEILQLVAAATAQTMNFKIVALLMVDDERKELVLKSTQSQSQDYVRKPNIPLKGSVAGSVVQTGKPVFIQDVKNEPEYHFPDVAMREGLTSLACIPLRVRERIIGVLNCYTEKYHDFSEDEVSVLTTLGNQVAVAIENSKLMVKGALLQEMHHRVKNNLQTIASLLRLQASYAAERSAKDVLDESIGRVLAVASVHDLLSREDLDTISVRKIAESIMTTTQQSLLKPGKRINMWIEGEDMRLTSDKANSVALVLNELMQNGVEHGFAQANDGNIVVRLLETNGDAGERWGLEVRNTGDPLPPDFDIRKRSDLGLKIVDSLTHGDLHGTFTLTTDEAGGQTVAAISFPK